MIVRLFFELYRLRFQIKRVNQRNERIQMQWQHYWVIKMNDLSSDKKRSLDYVSTLCQVILIKGLLMRN